MTGLALLLAASAMGVDYGWRPHEEGGVEYIIQIEPEVFASLQAGGDIISEIHPDAGDVRRFRIRVGRGTLPREEAQAATADDGPLPPAPPGDETSSDESTPSTKSASTAEGRSASPPLNQLAQGSGYGNPFGGYSRSTGAGASSPGAAASGASGAAASDNYGAARTSAASPGSSRAGYTDSTGASGTGSPSTSANSGAAANSGDIANGNTGASADSAWNRGEVRTAGNQQTVTASSSNANTGGASTAASTGRYASQPTASHSTANQQPVSSAGTAASSASGQTQPAPQPAYRGAPRDYSAATGAADGGGYSPGQAGAMTPITSEYDNSRSAATSGAPQGPADEGRWSAAPASRAQDQGIAPPPAYPPGNGAEQPGYAGPATSGGYANGGYIHAYGNQYPPGAAPPLLPAAAAPGNYGYVPAGYAPYQQAAPPGAGHGYGQAPGYYPVPPVLTASANNATESSSRTRSRRDEDEEEEEDYRERRSTASTPATSSAPPTAQANLATSEPWLAFTITIVLLFASIGGNIYLLWISQDFYWRYKELANDLRTFNSAAS